MPNYQMLHQPDHENTGLGVQKKIEIYGKKTGSAGAAIADHMIGVPVLGTVLAVKSLISTEKHRQNLNSLTASAPDCTCAEGECIEIINYLIGQKEKKLVKKGLKVIPGVGTISTGVFKAKGIYKFLTKERGEKRLEMARLLWFCAASENGAEDSGCQKARQIIGELCGPGEVNDILGCTDKGIAEIFRKMASS